MTTYGIDAPPPPPYEDDSSALNKTICMSFDTNFGTCPCCELLTMGSDGCLHCAYTRHKCDKCHIQMDDGIVRLKLVLCKTCATVGPSSSSKRVHNKDAYKERLANQAYSK